MDVAKKEERVFKRLETLEAKLEALGILWREGSAAWGLGGVLAWGALGVALAWTGTRPA